MFSTKPKAPSVELMYQAVGPANIRGRSHLLQLYTIVGRASDISNETKINSNTFEKAVIEFRKGQYESANAYIEKVNDYMPDACEHIYCVSKQYSKNINSEQLLSPHDKMPLYDLSEESMMQKRDTFKN